MQNLFHREMTVHLDEQKDKLLINQGFFSFHTNPSPLHCHYYAELHLFAQGGGTYATTERTYTVKAGELLVFPAQTYHACRVIEPDSLHIDFQMTSTVRQVVQRKLPQGVPDALFAEIKRLGEHRTSERLRAYLSLAQKTFPAPREGALQGNRGALRRHGNHPPRGSALPGSDLFGWQHLQSLFVFSILRR